MHRGLYEACVQHVYADCGGVQLAIVVEMLELGRVFKQMRNKSRTAVSGPKATRGL
jgi:hypothetical protein